MDEEGQKQPPGAQESSGGGRGSIAVPLCEPLWYNSRKTSIIRLFHDYTIAAFHTLLSFHFACRYGIINYIHFLPVLLPGFFRENRRNYGSSKK